MNDFTHLYILSPLKLYYTGNLFHRVEFDAYRSDFEILQTGPRDSTTTMKMEEAQHKYNNHREKFDKLRADVSIKLKFLEENKVGFSTRPIIFVFC